MPLLSLIGAIGAAVSAVGSFLAPLAGAFGGLGAIGKTLLGIGLNLAASAIQAKLAKKNARAEPGGVDLQLSLGEDVPRKVMCGRFASVGHLVYANTHGEGNIELQQVFVLSHFYTTALDKVWIDGIEATLGDEDGNKGRTVTSGDYAGKIWIKYYDGRQTAVDSRLLGGANPIGRWTSEHIGWGVSYVIATMHYDREKLTSPPQFLFEGRGAPLYDVRKDSTVGGFGAHRWNDVSTWEYSANPALIDYCYRRGFSVNDDDFCGMFMPASDLPLAKFATAANICDELVGLRTRYVCSIGLDCDAEHGDNIEAIMKSCGGIVVNAVDGSYPVIGTNQPIVAELTDDDLIVGAQVSFRRRRSMDQIVNSVSGTYPNPGNLWNQTGYVRATDAATTAIDRRTLDVQINFETVPDGDQAAQLAAIYFSENRFEATAQITVRPRWQVLEAGDWIRWNSARYGDRVYMVTDAELGSLDSDGPRNAILNLQERDGSIYTGVGVTVPLIPLGPATPVFQAELQDFTVVAVLGQGSDTRVYPAIRVSWSQPTDPTVAGAVLQWRPKAQPEVTLDRSVPAADQTIAILADGVLSQTLYEVRHKIVADPPRPTAWSAWEEVITLDSAFSDVIVGLAQVKTDIEKRFRQQQKEIDDVVKRMTDLATSQSLSGFANYTTTTEVVERVGNAEASIIIEQEVRASETEALAAQQITLSANVGSVTATLANEMLVRANVDEALASNITLLNTGLGTTNAALLTEQTTRATADTALSSTITAVNADYNGRFASGLIKFEAIAAPLGVDARFSIGLRAGTGDAFKYSGFFLDLRTVGGVQRSEFSIFADRFSVTDGATTTYPLAFVGGVLYAQGLKVQWADIVNVTINTAQIANAAITSAKIGLLEVGESNISLSSITAQSAVFNTLTVVGGIGWEQVATITISNPSARFVFIDWSFYQQGSRLGGGTAITQQTRLRRVNDGEILASVSATIPNASPGSLNASSAQFKMDTATFTTVTYVVETNLSAALIGTTAGAVIRLLWGKR